MIDHLVLSWANAPIWAYLRIVSVLRQLLLEFWLRILDLASWANAPRCVYLWIVGRASDVTDWGEGES